MWTCHCHQNQQECGRALLRKCSRGSDLVTGKLPCFLLPSVCHELHKVHIMKAEQVKLTAVCFASFIRSVSPLSFCPVMPMDELLSAAFLTSFILCFHCVSSFCPFSGPSGLKPQCHRRACGGCSVYLVFMCLSSALSEEWSSESSIQQRL